MRADRCGRWWAGLLAGALIACDGNGNPEVQKPSGTPDGGGGSSGSSSHDGGAGDEGGVADATDGFVLPEASTVAVRVGIVPVPAASGDAGTTNADETLAHLDVIAAGSRAVTVLRRWDALYDDADQANATSWQYLGGLSTLYADAGRPLLLSLAVLDRGIDARPSGVTGAWDGAATINSVHALIDRTFSTFGSELRYLSIGTEVDRWLDQAPPTERAQFIAFVKDVFAYARQHPALPPELELGVTLSATGAQKTGTAAAALLAESDVAIISYHALDESFHARPASSAAGDLDALWTALGGPAGKQQIVLQEVAYPSATEAQSSLEQQRTFFDGLFVALLSRRERFPFVVVRGLNEARAESCAADAEALGAPGDSTAIASHCSFGLRSSAGDVKPAWATMVDGLATFSSP